MSALFSVVLALASGLTPRTPGAERVEWRASVDACPVDLGVVGVVDQALARGFEAERIRISGEVHGGGPRYELALDVELDGIVERHRFAALGCEALEGYAALVVGLTLRPELGSGDAPQALPIEVRALQAEAQTQIDPGLAIAVEGSRALPAAPPPLASSPPVQVPEQVEPELEMTTAAEELPEPATRTRAHAELELRALTAFNLFPTVAGGPRLRAGVGARRFAAGLGAAGWLGGMFEASEGQGRAWVHGWSGELYGCAIPVAGSWSLRACANVGAGQMISRGLASDQPSTRDAAWVFLGGELRLAWSPRPAWALDLGLGLAGSLLRPAFHSIDARFVAGQVFSTLDLGVRFAGFSRGAHKHQ